MNAFTAGDFGLPESAPCPFCEGTETELHSPFGPQLSVATYWCRDCHTAFDWLKWSAGGSHATSPHPPNPPQTPRSRVTPPTRDAAVRPAATGDGP